MWLRITQLTHRIFGVSSAQDDQLVGITPLSLENHVPQNLHPKNSEQESRNILVTR